MGGTTTYKMRMRYKEKVREWYADFMAHSYCYECGASVSTSVLHWHHMDPSAKRYAITTMVSKAMAIKTILLEMEKCLVLCEKCHIKAHEQDYYREGYEWIARAKMTENDWHAPQDLVVPCAEPGLEVADIIYGVGRTSFE